MGKVKSKMKVLKNISTNYQENYVSNGISKWPRGWKKRGDGGLRDEAASKIGSFGKP